MQIKSYSTKVFGSDCQIELMEFDKTDGVKWKALFDKWIILKQGLREYKAREPNLPEGLSEVAFCLFSGSGRLISLKGQLSTAASFDTYSIKTSKAEQIKATSVASDLTSFGPKSKWDDLYFLDFYNQGKLDGTFNVYLIPNDLIYGMKVNALQTFLDQQGEKRRPRFSITEGIIKVTDLKPIAVDVKVW